MQRNIKKPKNLIYRPKRVALNSVITDQKLAIDIEEPKLATDVEASTPSQSLEKQKNNNENKEDMVFASTPTSGIQIDSIQTNDPEAQTNFKPSRRIDSSIRSPQTSHKKLFYRMKQVNQIQTSLSCDDEKHTPSSMPKMSGSKDVSSKEEVIGECHHSIPSLESSEEKEAIGELHTSTEVAKFVGPYADNYADLYNFIKSQPSIPPWPIANFSKDDRLYIEETEEVKEATQRFLHYYWAVDDNVDTTVQVQQQKQRKEARNAKHPIMASCANFVLATIDKKPYCYIGLSIPREGSEQFYDSLSAFINEFNQKQDVEYVLINGSTGNFSKLISALAGKTTFATFRTCAEKTLASFFAKLWMSGTHFFLQGGVSILMYPFKTGERYGKAGSSPENKKIVEIKPFTKNGTVVNILNISKSLFTPIIMCCPACQETRPIVFKIWHGAKTFFEESKKLEKPKDRTRVRTTSPIRRSTESKTTLQTHSVFNTDDSNEPPKNEDTRKWKKYSKSVF